MARQYHSASSISTGRRCARAWYYYYVARIRPREYTWAEIEAGADAPPRARSKALGTAVHAVGEAYWRGEAVDWHSRPGEIYQSGLHLLPSPEDCARVSVEGSLGPDQAPGSDTQGIRIGGILWAGRRDLVYQLDAAPAPVLVDYKTTSSVARWAHTAEELSVDLAACLYAVSVAREWALPAGARVDCLWPYLETGRRRHAVGVRFSVDTAAAADIIGAAAEDARRLDRIRVEDDAEPDPSACAAYGGCDYHESNGGPCRAVRRYGRLVALRAKGTDMHVSPELQARIDALRARSGKAPATAPAVEADVEEAVEADVEEDVVPTPPPTRARIRRPSRAKPAAAPAAKFAPTIDGDAVETADEVVLVDDGARVVESMARRLAAVVRADPVHVRTDSAGVEFSPSSPCPTVLRDMVIGYVREASVARLARVLAILAEEDR
jgi:hypothetical protein